jgi:fibronectin-binding autotransporter adhesin
MVIPAIGRRFAGVPRRPEHDHRRAVVIGACLLVVVLLVPAGPSALGATPSVNCNAGGNLQAKIDAAAPGSTILVKGTCFGSFEISGKGLTLKGNPTATLDGNDLDRTLDVTAAGKAVHLVGLTVTGGSTGTGAGIGSLAASLTLTNVRVTGNLAAQTSGDPRGGGILSTGDLILTGSTVSANRVLATENAFDPDGGGLYVQNGDLTIKNSVISGNRATAVPDSGFNRAKGGGFYLDGGTLTVQGSTISGNRVTTSAPASAEAYGAAGYLVAGSAAVISASVVQGNITTAISDSGQAFAEGGGLFADQLRLARSTVDGNRAIATATGTNAFAEGGGIDAATSVTMTSSTVSRNSAMGKTSAAGFSASGHGGGIFSPALEATNSTIALNGVRATSPGAGGASSAQGGGVYAQSGVSSLINSTVAGNTTAASGDTVSRVGGGVLGSPNMTLNASILANNTAIFGPDCSGGPASAGHNLIRNPENCSIVLLGTDKVGMDPKLGLLQANGGPTQTMAIALTSPARDAIPTPCPVARDQRGVHRPQGPKCDIGAYERKLT